MYLEFDESRDLACLDVDLEGDFGRPAYWPKLNRNVQEWCNKNMKGGAILDYETDHRSYDDFSVTYILEFDLETDAVLFKLKWL